VVGEIPIFEHPFQFSLFHVICPAVIMITALTMIYRAVRQSEKKMSKYGVGTIRKNLQKRVQEKSDYDTIIEAHPPGSRFSLTQIFGSGRLLRLRFNKTSKRGSISTKMKKRQERSKSRQVMFKAFAYCCVWLLTWILYIPFMLISYVFGATTPLPYCICWLSFRPCRVYTI